MVKNTFSSIVQRLFFGAALGLGSLSTATMASDLSQQELERQMEQAHEQLEEAAEKIAMLSRTMAGAEVRGILQHVDVPRKAMLGIHIDNSDKNVSGVRVRRVIDDGPADLAGLQDGDVIKQFNGVRLDEEDAKEAVDMLLDELRDLEPDDQVSVQYERDNQLLSAQIKMMQFDSSKHAYEMFHEGHHGFGIKILESVGEMFEDSDFSFDLDFDPEDLEQLKHLEHLKHLPKVLEESLSGIVSGVSNAPMIAIMGGPNTLPASLKLTSVNDDLGAYFGVQEGALVTANPKDETLGLKAGDVIVAVDGKKIGSHHDVHHAVRNAKSGQSLAFDIVRERQALAIDVLVPKFDLGDDWECEESKSGNGRRCVKKDGDVLSFNFSDDEE